MTERERERERERKREREREGDKGTQRRGGFILISSLERKRGGGGFEGQRERESDMENLTEGEGLIERKKGKFLSHLA